MMQLLPGVNGFTDAYDRGQPQVVWTKLVADLETPVATMMKLAEGQRYGFLLEFDRGRGGPRPLLVYRSQAGSDLALQGEPCRGEPLGTAR